MILTGGVNEETTSSKKIFEVGMLNLTHADLFGEEIWFQFLALDDETTTTDDECSKVHDQHEESNNTDNQDLWEHSSVKCAPSPRHNHLTAVVNKHLYVFQGNAEKPDYHVYRVSLSSILANDWSDWRRILPRGTLNSTCTSNAPFKGGIWNINSNGTSPRLVAFANTPHSNQLARRYQCNNQEVWTYDFGTDSWTLWYQFYQVDFSGGDYNAVVVRNNLVIVGTTFRSSQSGRLVWLDLKTKRNSFYCENAPHVRAGDDDYSGPMDEFAEGDVDVGSCGYYDGYIVANQILVAYDDDQSPDDSSILVGYGGSLNHRHRGLDLAFSRIKYSQESEEEPVEIGGIVLKHPLRLIPEPRTGHSAVLSSAGNMYIFGGRDLPPAEPLLWRINIGGKDQCRLIFDRFFPHHTNTGGAIDSASYYPDTVSHPREVPHYATNATHDAAPVVHHKPYNPADFVDDTDNTNNSYYEDGDDDDSIVMILFAFSLLQLVLCYLASIRHLRRTPLEQQQTPRGLSTREMDEGFPAHIIGDDSRQEEEEEECSICLLSFASGEQYRELPCKHIFHRKCVDVWLKSETTCPLCRTSCRLRRPPVETHVTCLSRMFRALQQRQREAIPQDDNDEDDDEGLEMSNVQSLELLQQRAFEMA